MKVIEKLLTSCISVIIISGIAIVFFNGLEVTLLKDRVNSDKVAGVYRNNIIICEFEYACLHETGHWIDDGLGRPSKSESFKLYIDTMIEWCNDESNEGLYNYHYWCWIKDFYGINGNPLHDGYWGGYGELYADIYEYWKLHTVAPPLELQEFYR